MDCPHQAVWLGTGEGTCMWGWMCLGGAALEEEVSTLVRYTLHVHIGQSNRAGFTEPTVPMTAPASSCCIVAL